MNRHPIQVQSVSVRELFIRSFFPPRLADRFEPAEAVITTETGTYDSVNSTVQVGVRIMCGMDRDPTPDELAEIRQKQLQPFRLHVHIVGEFHIDAANFPVEKISTWARINAPALMYPFLREQVYSLTGRCGYSPLLLPLVVLPTVKIEARGAAQAPTPIASVATVQPELIAAGLP